jgi:hypothetical protein
VRFERLHFRKGAVITSTQKTVEIQIDSRILGFSTYFIVFCLRIDVKQVSSLYVFIRAVMVATTDKSTGRAGS